MKTLMTRQRQRTLMAEVADTYDYTMPNLSSAGHRLVISNETSMLGTENYTASTFTLLSEKEQSISEFTIAFGVLLILTATIFNIHDLYGLFLSRRHWTSTHVFLLALAISDLLVTLLALPGFIVYTTYLETWPLGVDLCLLWLYVDWITTITTSTFVMTISLNYVLLHYMPRMTYRISATSATAVALFIYANILFLPVFVQDSISISMKDSYETVCFIRTYEHGRWQIAYFVCGCYVPVVVVLVCYIIMRRRKVIGRKGNCSRESLVSVITMQSLDDMTTNSSKTETDNNEHALEPASIVALGVIFLICWVPGYIYDLADAYGNYDNHSLEMMSFWLIYLCAVLNPIALHLPKMSQKLASSRTWRKLYTYRC